jgi:hypothetical protein
MKTAQLIVVISAALEAYDRGDRMAALDALQGIDANPLPEHPAWTAQAAVARSEAVQKGYVDPAAAGDWCELAKDRIRHEMGHDVVALTPVSVALKSALACLGAGWTSSSLALWRRFASVRTMLLMAFWQHS